MSPATDRFQEALIYLREQTAPANSWAPVHEQLYLALAGVLAYKLGELALCVVRHSEVFGMEGSSSSKWHQRWGPVVGRDWMTRREWSKGAV